MDDKNQWGALALILFTSMAGGMAWGIRGQYGHERGAMIAGVLVGLVAVTALGARLSAIQAARSVALCALGISVGGCMTYGQTVGLSHDTPLVGNVEAYRWGMLGLAIKGGIWIGLGTALLGMGLSRVRYRPLETGLLVIAMTVAMLVGVQLLNRPYVPDEKLLPPIYFSDHWYWEENVDSPRRESWGGLLCALTLLIAYVGVVKRDGLAVRLAFWGILGGAVGFPTGQSLQAAYAWYPDWLETLPTYAITRYFNWWNIMETTFGLTFGAIVGLGLWLNRQRIQPKQFDSTDLPPDHGVVLPPAAEWLLVGIHAVMLIAWNFSGDVLTDDLDVYMEQAFPMITIPVMAVLAGRIWPFVMALPMVVIPIAGKTLNDVILNSATPHIAPALAWILYGILPVLLALLVALYFAQPTHAFRGAGKFSGVGLITTAWIYFALNYVYFGFPLPWQPWGGRHPNALIFAICLLGLTLLGAVGANSQTAAEDHGTE